VRAGHAGDGLHGHEVRTEGLGEAQVFHQHSGVARKRAGFITHVRRRAAWTKNRSAQQSVKQREASKRAWPWGLWPTLFAVVRATDMQETRFVPLLGHPHAGAGHKPLT
jgi:hypothetical protein